MFKTECMFLCNLQRKLHWEGKGSLDVFGRAVLGRCCTLQYEGQSLAKKPEAVFAIAKIPFGHWQKSHFAIAKIRFLP